MRSGTKQLLATCSALAILALPGPARAGGPVTTVTGQTYLTINGTNVTGNVTNPIGVDLAPGVASNPFVDVSYVHSLYLNNATVTGAVVNAGTIQGVDAPPHAALNLASGVRIRGSVITQGLTNSGKIIGTFMSNAGINGAYGVSIEGTQFSGGISNSGEIAATANSTSLDATATGIVAGIIGPQNVTSAFNLTNAGIITATATSGRLANASGVRQYSNGGVGLNLVNSGTIMANAVGTTTNPQVVPQAYAAGIDVKATTVAGTITNTGLILAALSISENVAGSAGNAFGLFLPFGGTVSVVNGGTIDARASGSGTAIGSVTANVYRSANTVSAKGIYAFAGGGSYSGGYVLAAGITNTGRINATAQAVARIAAFATGIEVNTPGGGGATQSKAHGGLFTGEVVNRGTIAVTAGAAMAPANANGVIVAAGNGVSNLNYSAGGTAAGTIINAGLITVSATGNALGDFPASASGIKIAFFSFVG
ncbi:MAG TPA: hypothetical protein VKT70_15290, partial [Stellaceae bacterium]|nr:hypothetical protein [Stellaceae bacterium]